jgi:hypothetical protein
MAKFLPLMRVGIFRDRHGANYDITKAVIEKLAATFDPARPPHLLVGHPDGEKAPSFGIVEALKVVGDKLMFRPGKVAAEFAALVRRGGFPGVSAGLTRDMSRLDHVAFLSAQKPAIDGLEPIAEFSASADNPTDAIDVSDPAAAGLAEFAAVPDWWVSARMKEIATLFRGLKNDVIERKGAEAADALLPESSISYLQDDPPVEEPVDGAEPEFSVTLPDPAVGNSTSEEWEAKYNAMLPVLDATKTLAAEFEASVKKLTAERDALAARVSEQEKQARLAEFGAWVEERIAEGKILPDQKQTTVTTMETLFTGTGAEFSSDPVNFPKALDVYKKDLMSRPRIVPAGETPAPEFATARALSSVLDGPMIGRLARAYIDEQAAKGVKVNEYEAVSHVMGKI